MNYTWKVTGMKGIETPNDSNTIIQTYWEKTGIDEHGNRGTFSGASPFNPIEIDINTFVPFNQLTEKIVLGWIQAVVIGDYEIRVNTEIQKQIDQKKIKDEALPWI